MLGHPKVPGLAYRRTYAKIGGRVRVLRWTSSIPTQHAPPSDSHSHCPSTRFPAFRYHPDPLRTGTIVPSEAVCRCCGRARGVIYTGPVYAADDLESAFCPWCISDGTAAERFDAEFGDCHALEQAGIDGAVIEEVSRRTPDFVSWQGERGLVHCHDACEFHGDLPRERLETLSNDARAAVLACLSFDMTWERVVAEYEPGGQPAIYWFRCRHCSADLYYADYH